MASNISIAIDGTAIDMERERGETERERRDRALSELLLILIFHSYVHQCLIS